MDRSPCVICESWPIERAHRLFTTMGLRHMIVMSRDYARPVGMITRYDLIPTQGIERLSKPVGVAAACATTVGTSGTNGTAANVIAADSASTDAAAACNVRFEAAANPGDVIGAIAAVRGSGDGDSSPRDHDGHARDLTAQAAREETENYCSDSRASQCDTSRGACEPTPLTGSLQESTLNAPLLSQI